LRLDRPATPCGLVLEVAERLELTLRRDDLLDPVGAERADQLVLEIRGADVGCIAEHAPEPAFLAGVAQPDYTFPFVLRSRAANRLCPADRHDLDACGGEVAAKLRRNRFKGDPVGDSFDEDDSHVRKLA
jgi:hypothetical protein